MLPVTSCFVFVIHYLLLFLLYNLPFLLFTHDPLPITHYLVNEYWLRSTNYVLFFWYLLLIISDLLRFTYHSSLITYHFMNYYLLLITYYLLLATCYLSFITHYSWFITYYLSLTTHYVLCSIDYFSLLASYSLILIS